MKKILKKIFAPVIKLITLPYYIVKSIIVAGLRSIKFSLLAPVKILQAVYETLKAILQVIFESPVKWTIKTTDDLLVRLQTYSEKSLEKIGQAIIFLAKLCWQLLLPVRNPQRWFRANYQHIMDQVVEDQNFANRLFSSILMILIALPSIIIGGWLLQILLIVTVSVAAWEWANLSPSGVFKNQRLIFTIFMAVAAILMRPLGPAAPALISIFLCMEIFFPSPSVEKNLHNQIGFGYIFMAALSFTWIHDNFGALATLWLVFTMIATDVGAFLGGRALGGKKLAPKISPNKTISGALCALGASAVIGFLYSGISGKPILFFILLSILTSAMAQAGDLYESMLKRRVSAKDSGNIIPGHGGVLDRIDGFLMASPMAFLVLRITEWVG